MNAPREMLDRSVPFEVTRTAEDGDGLTFEGYAAVWDSPTEINSAREGNFIEVMRRGSFKRTTQAKMPVFMFDHGQHPMIGPMPLGVIQEAREDDRGLYVRARFSDNWLIQPVRDACAEGAIPGMSFRMSIPEGGDKWTRGKDGQLPTREISEVKCMELGPVVFPAYTETSVGVRSQEVLEALTDSDVRADLARALFVSEHVPSAPDESEETRMDLEAAQIALRDAVMLLQAHMAGTEPANEASQQQLMNHLLNARAVLSGGAMEMKSAEPDLDISRDDSAEETPATSDETADGTSTEPGNDTNLDSTDEVTPRGATDPATARFLRQLAARERGV